MEWTKEKLETELTSFLQKHQIPAQKDPGDGKYYIYMKMRDGESDLKIAIEVQDTCIITDTYMPTGVPNMQMMQKIYYMLNLINEHSEFGTLFVTDNGKICLHYPVDMVSREATEDVLGDAIAFPGYTSEQVVKAVEPIIDYDADPDKVFEKVYGKKLKG